MDHVRRLKRLDAAFGVAVCEGCCATRAARSDLDGVFARFRFLAKAIDDAQVERAKRHA
jgi:tartrate dehydratase alpha subunit/fumarate hydratase class I-like protein